MVIKGRLLRAFPYKWRNVNNGTYESCWCGRWPCFNGDDELIPRDVPKGHLVVYVGEDCKRYVIRVSFLDHPLFKALLERAREEYEFTPDMRLCIPCDENTFANILRCVTKYQKRRQVPYKWRNVNNGTYESCWCGRWPCFNGDDELIPRDVPKGHLVVYVGEDCKRYVIRVSFLDHPLFKALLERAREEYEFTPDMRLCIPCDENTFANILRCVTKYQKRRTCLPRRF